MKWTLDANEMQEYGKKTISNILDSNIPCNVQISGNGRVVLTIPTEDFRKTIQQKYESSPSLQAKYDKEAFVNEIIDSSRENLKEGFDRFDAMVRNSDKEYEREQAYQEFCQIDGVTEEEKAKAKRLIDAGFRKDSCSCGLASALDMECNLQSFANVLTNRYPNYNIMPLLENPCEDAFNKMADDLRKMKELRAGLDEVQASFFLHDPKADTRACLGAWLHTTRIMQEPDYAAIIEDTKIPEVADFHRRQTDALFSCIDALGKLRRETDDILRSQEKTDALTEEDGQALFLKAYDITARYADQCESAALDHNRPIRDTPLQFELLTEPDMIQNCAWAEAGTAELDTLRCRFPEKRLEELGFPEEIKESLAEETMRGVYSKHPDCFDYEALDRTSAQEILERGGGDEDLRDLAGLAAIIRPDIKDTELYAYKLTEPESAEEHPNWTITGIRYSPREYGLEVEAYRNGECVHLSQQLRQWGNGTASLPYPYDSDRAEFWTHILKDNFRAVNPDETQLCQCLGASAGHGEETFREIVGRAMTAVADEDRCIPDREAVFYQEPRKDYVIVSLAPDETPDKKPHEIHFTEEDFEELDKKKTFPKGYTAYKVSTSEDGIIRKDTFHPEMGGKRLTDACPDFHDASYSLKAVQKAMKKATKQTGR